MPSGLHNLWKRTFSFIPLRQWYLVLVRICASSCSRATKLLMLICLNLSFSLAKSLDILEKISYNKKEKTIAFQESITDTQQLSVKLQIYYPEKKNDLCYEVIKWKKEAVGEWKKDDFLPVYRNK